ncbi:hypothetical protein F5X68DRAFT_217373 [Plectosphaerella plurivora]|uniref:Uncharacterized protein n=1 Tax=Plectosphaerella plurivora TaxID=936078 RepID=A0A9P9A755_9PEZI|nr:hypothetical protein F5X68DRAFT_217373 [Plectosphaerella plurivora]
MGGGGTTLRRPYSPRQQHRAGNAGAQMHCQDDELPIRPRRGASRASLSLLSHTATQQSHSHSHTYQITGQGPGLDAAGHYHQPRGHIAQELRASNPTGHAAVRGCQPSRCRAGNVPNLSDSSVSDNQCHSTREESPSPREAPGKQAGNSWLERDEVPLSSADPRAHPEVQFPSPDADQAVDTHTLAGQAGCPVWICLRGASLDIQTLKVRSFGDYPDIATTFHIS